MLKYVFVSSAWPLALMLYAPILYKEVEGEYVALKDPIKLPGCVPIWPKDVVNPMTDRTKQEHNFFLQVGSGPSNVFGAFGEILELGPFFLIF